MFRLKNGNFTYSSGNFCTAKWVLCNLIFSSFVYACLFVPGEIKITFKGERRGVLRKSEKRKQHEPAGSEQFDCVVIHRGYMRARTTILGRPRNSHAMCVSPPLSRRLLLFVFTHTQHYPLNISVNVSVYPIILCVMFYA